MPLIRQLQAQHNQVVVGCTKWQQEFLERELADVSFVDLFGYAVTYSKKMPLALKILWQMPRLSLIVRRENLWLADFLSGNRIDVVISDNRYGLYTDKAECVFITHQPFIPAPFLHAAVNRVSWNFISKYDHCWIPDHENEDASLSGRLSHGIFPVFNMRYIGPLSRFSAASVDEPKRDILILLSGVEPQRSLLEEKLTVALAGSPLRVTLVRGTAGRTGKKFPANFSVLDVINTQQIKELLTSSANIICRSGYSTLMDLHALGLKALLVPTPHQPEQEYLAQYWAEKFGFTTLAQKEIDRSAILDALPAKKIHLPQSGPC